VGKTQRNVRELQASVACELASLAIALTARPTVDYGFTISRIKQLVEVLETTATAILIQEPDVSWERLATEIGDGVTRQSFHRRLSRRVNELMDLPADEIRYRQPRGEDVVESIPDQHWVSHLRKIEHLANTAANHGYHPELVRHRRKGRLFRVTPTSEPAAAGSPSAPTP
jgi:hypothetical protein